MSDAHAARCAPPRRRRKQTAEQRCRFAVMVVLLLATALQAGERPRQPERQVGNILYSIPDQYAGVRMGAGVVLAQRSQLQRGEVDHFITIGPSRTLDGDLQRLPMADFCRSLGAAMAQQEVGGDGLITEPRILDAAERSGYDACAIAAKAAADAAQPAAVQYVITRARDQSSVLALRALESADQLDERAPAFNGLLAGIAFANLGDSLAAAEAPLPDHFSLEPQPRELESGTACRTVQRQQCMSQMMGSFPNAYPVYSCLPVGETVCD